MLIVIVLVGGMLMLMPGMVFAEGHGGGGHGGGGHSGGGHGGGGHGGGGHGHGGGHTNYSFSFGFGYYGPGPYYYPYYYSSYYYPSYYPYYPSYYSPGVVYIDPPAPPPIVVQRPVVVEKQTVIVQPQQFDQSTLQLNMNLQYKKSELLKQLQSPNKEQRKEAINELAGFSFDDNVRCALQNVLLSDPDLELRAEAAHSFGEVKNDGARAALEKARVEDPSVDVRKAADEAISSLNGN
jgi:hypothetical protein